MGRENSAAKASTTRSGPARKASRRRSKALLPFGQPVQAQMQAAEGFVV
jgi:hypothetical protein